MYACGCKKDRHAVVGEGKININKLNNVIEYCKKNNISMIREY